jgi:hypothetical protein
LCHCQLWRETFLDHDEDFPSSPNKDHFTTGASLSHQGSQHEEEGKSDEEKDEQVIEGKSRKKVGRKPQKKKERKRKEKEKKLG